MRTYPLSPLCKKIEKIAKKCGKIILEADRSAFAIDVKAGHANFVTTYDKTIEEKLKKELTAVLPEAVFVGEEGDTADDINSGYCFVVDPIDGTTDFIHGYPISCVSIGLLKDGKPVLGVVCQPYLGEVYSAERGRGAFLNGKPIHVSENDLENGLVLFGTSPYKVELHEKTMQVALEYLNRATDLRRSGSAAFDICSVAAGRAELFFEWTLSPWDYAASSLILTEAGGIITTMDGEEISFEHPCSILVRNRESTK